MNKQQCFYLGLITRPQGIKGNVAIYLDVDSPKDYIEMESVFVEINNSLVPFFIDSLSLKGNKAVVKFEGISTEAEAKSLVNSALYLPIDVLPKLKGNKFYYHEVIGYTVNDKVHGLIGTIENILEYPNNALLQINSNKKEILIPIRDEVILSVDRNASCLNIKAPEGLIDIYMADKHVRDEE